jgi:hypothetical protein
MKRLGRILYLTVVAVSLLLCMATVALWVRSGWVRDTLRWVEFSRDGYFCHIRLVFSSKGGLQFIAWHNTAPGFIPHNLSPFQYFHDAAIKYPLYDRTGADSLRGYGAMGFEVILEAKYGGREPLWVNRSLTLPLWFPAALFALLPLHFLLRHGRRRLIARRLAQRRCPSCGYDLRASGGRCPECGVEHLSP